MTLPTGKDVQAVDPVLTNMLVAYYQSENRFVADRVFPGVSVDKDSGTFYKFTKKYWFTDELQERAYGTKYGRAGFGVETDTYTTEQWALSQPIADEVRANSQVPMDLEQAAVRYLGMKALIRRERLFASIAFATGAWGASDGSVSNKWSDYSASDPVGDVRTGKRTVSQLTGMIPNVMVMGEIVEDRLVNHPDLIDRIKFVQQAGISSIRSALAALFGVDEVVTASAIYNSANEGQDASMAAIVDDDFILVYRNPRPGLFDASGGYTFNWAPGGGLGGIQPIWRDGESDADLVKIKNQYVHKIVASDVGYIVLDVTD